MIRPYDEFWLLILTQSGNITLYTEDIKCYFGKSNISRLSLDGFRWTILACLPITFVALRYVKNCTFNWLYYISRSDRLRLYEIRIIELEFSWEDNRGRQTEFEFEDDRSFCSLVKERASVLWSCPPRQRRLSFNTLISYTNETQSISTDKKVQWKVGRKSWS